MALKNELPLNPVVNIIVNLATISAPRKAFDTAILIGDCTGVEDFDNARVVTYDSVDSILSAGFASSSRIAQAAQLIFGQQKTPKQVMIGKIGTVTEGETTRTESGISALYALISRIRRFSRWRSTLRAAPRTACLHSPRQSRRCAMPRTVVSSASSRAACTVVPSANIPPATPMLLQPSSAGRWEP